MRIPSKVTPYRESVFSKFSPILRELKTGDIRPHELYGKVKRNVEIGEFIEALDCLYVLGKVDFLPDREVLHYVEDDSVR